MLHVTDPLFAYTSCRLQSAEEVEPTTVEKVLPGHAVHAPAPGELEYVPTAHEVHEAAPCDEYLPAAQGVQVAAEVAPTAVEKVPATQGVHEELVAPPVEYEPAGQS